MNRVPTDYEVFESSSDENRRGLRQEELILEITIALSEALAEKGITRAELAKRLGKTKGFVSQILAGGRNLTLRTIADVADALGCHIGITCERVRQNEGATIVAINDYKHKAPRWVMPEPIVINARPLREKEFARDQFDPLLETAA